MQYVKEHFNSTYEIKKSKFIAHLFPYKEFDTIMKELKDEHPKARHFVYAYRYLNEFNQIVENSSDDGEPKGTSGKPSLAVLSGSDIINSGVIIVRYFGGIKLGTGGLVKAYSDAVNLVLKESVLFEYVDLKQKSLTINYTDLSKIEYNISKLDIAIVEKEFLDNITLKLEASNEQLKLLEEILPREYKLI